MIYRMVTGLIPTASLLKVYVKWSHPSSLLRHTHSMRNFGLGVGLVLRSHRTPWLGRLAPPAYRNSSTTAQCGNASFVTAVAKGLHSQIEEGEVAVDQSRGGLPRFHVTELPAAKGMIVRVDGDEFWHMTRVLRLNVNDRIELFDGNGGLVEGTLVRVTKNSVEVAALTSRQTLPRTGPNWHVAAAFGNLKGGRADWLVEKCTELGAQTLTPLLTQRSATIAEQRNDRWHRISMAATKQCQRLHTLDVRKPTPLLSFLADVRKAEVAFLATARAPPLVQQVLQRAKKPEGGLLLIGPEGDFTPEEMERLVGAGAAPVGLGQRRLRVETAAIAILTTVMLFSEGLSTEAQQ